MYFKENNHVFPSSILSIYIHNGSGAVDEDDAHSTSNVLFRSTMTLTVTTIDMCKKKIRLCSMFGRSSDTVKKSTCTQDMLNDSAVMFWYCSDKTLNSA